ncbi:MAG: disulfide oxidoreductase [Spirochaetes bacterium]|nr:disulfide oxidoreductase [Spirochaetota bacterium]
MKITPETKLTDIIADPAVSDVFKKYSFMCPSCKGMVQDTVAHVIINNGLDSDSFLKELNDSRK